MCLGIPSTTVVQLELDEAFWIKGNSSDFKRPNIWQEMNEASYSFFEFIEQGYRENNISQQYV